LETPVTIIPPEILTRLDLVLVMTRKAGSIDYPFEERALEKVKNLRKAEFGGEVCVDGGINEENIKKCLEAGANLIAVGGAIWKVGEINEVIERLSDLTTR
jgi:ribulose-phosphate 3-epimerase